MTNLPDSTKTPNLLLRLRSPFSIGLMVLTIYAAFNSLWNLAAGQRSEYYAAIAKSMSLNFSNWFFGSFDPAGSVTLDKIPGSYWVPAIFVKLFGFSTWAVDAPNALAVIAAALIIVFAVRRISSNTAGLIAGFVVATTPVLIAVSRANQPQSYFILALSLALFATTKALTTGRRRHLISAGLFIALGFNFYMLEAWAVWPALIVGWLLLSKKDFAGKTLSVKLTDLFIAGSISAFASILWPLTVWLIPASSRPYIGGTFHNNPFEMIFGYNGLGRFGATASAAGTSYQTFTPPFSGDASIIRLFNAQLVGQIAWLLPAAIVAIVVLWFTKTNRAVVATMSVWFLSFAVMFSAVAGMHQFYTSALAIPVAGLIGLAVAEARRANLVWAQITMIGVASITALLISAQFSGYFAWVSFAQLIVAGIAAGAIVFKFQKYKWITVALTIVALTLTPAVWASDAMNHPSSINPVAGAESAMGGGPGGFAGRNNHGAFSGGGAANGLPNFGSMPGFGGPNANGGMPGFGGPNANGGMPGFAGMPGFGGSNANGEIANFGAKNGGFGAHNGSAGPSSLSSINQSLVTYLKANAAESKYQVAMFGAMSAAPYITQTDLSVLPIGGFDGADPTPTLAKFEQLVNSGEVKYVLAGGQGGVGGPGSNSNNASGSTSSETTSSQIDTWVSENCQTVDYSAAGSAGSATQAPSFFGNDQSPALYSCKAN